MSDRDTALRFRERAEEARRLAGELKDEAARVMLNRVAADYERLAELADASGITTAHS